MLVIGLTSIPPRFATLPRVLRALRDQTAAPDRVLLSLPRAYKRFGPAPALPPLPGGVEVCWVDHDDGPALKALEPARRLAGSGASLIYCDDDCLYGPEWAQSLLAARSDTGADVVAASGYCVERLRRRCDNTDGAHADIVQGFGGVLCDPSQLPQTALTGPESAWSVDDIWLSGHFARAGLRIALAPQARACVQPLDLPASLQHTTPRAQSNAACAAWLHETTGIWPPRDG